MDRTRIVSAIKKTILFSAVSHLILLTVYAIQTRNIDQLNIFAILDIDLYIPILGKGSTNLFLSFIFIALVYTSVYVFDSKNRQKK